MFHHDKVKFRRTFINFITATVGIFLETCFAVERCAVNIDANRTVVRAIAIITAICVGTCLTIASVGFDSTFSDVNKNQSIGMELVYNWTVTRVITISVDAGYSAAVDYFSS